MLAALGALFSSFTWAFASTRFAALSREVGAPRVNLARAIGVLPFYAAMTLVTAGPRGAAQGLSARGFAWLAVSTLCSYAVADNLFFAAARRIGVSTALSIASTYPLWAALAGCLVGGERFGPWRALGTLLCVGGIVTLVQRGTRGAEPHASARRDLGGYLLAVVTSLLWAGNAVTLKLGSVGLTVWQVNTVRFGCALAILYATVRLSPRAAPRTRPAGGWRVLVLPLVADGILGSVAFVYGLAHADLAIAAPLTSLAPLISVPFALWAGHERFSAAHVGAICATVAGAAILGANG
jgi:drug/metabolite transporter (DMT)-like permease